MGRHKEIIPLAPVKEFVKETTRLRVSEDATKLLVEDLNAYGEAIAHLAAENSTHRGNRTVQKKDIELAVKQYAATNN